MSIQFLNDSSAFKHWLLQMRVAIVHMSDEQYNELKMLVNLYGIYRGDVDKKNTLVRDLQQGMFTQVEGESTNVEEGTEVYTNSPEKTTEDSA